MPTGALVDTRPLRDYPAFRRLWLGSTASGIGSQFGAFAATYHIWDRTHSPAAVGFVGLAVAVPIVVVALVGGTFVDHVDRRALAAWTTAAQVAVSLAMAAVAALPGDSVMAMFGLVALASALSALTGPVLRSVVPGLLPPVQLAAGLALNHLSFQLAMLCGPVLAGLVTATWGTTWCFVIDALTFGAALAGIAGLPRTGRPPASRPAGIGAVVDGIRFAVGTPQVRGALLADLAATVLAMPMAIFPVINEERFGGSPGTLGLFGTAVAVGGVAASALSGLVTRNDRPGRTLLACGAVWAVALGVVGLAGALAVVLVALAVAGAADTWAVVCRATVVQSSTPESHRGRVAALEHVAGVAGPQLGNLRAGLLAAGTSGGIAMVTGALTCLTAVGLITLLTPPLRTFRTGAGR
ncbi:MFS transporter [Dactylosporangium fulvum]|uniref:MFS transporter n=1 Tax=Dactylosporangium fulvum TaxID=53359 RepID=A0ABY5W5V1_9ACTN|nr:MFS transporter [Dactylosporangium fulvum]UWP85360.1 MFS transporter [Dactylosporangium fulvum]